MKQYTFLTYICSKDQDKLTQFIWTLPFKIEIKEIVFAKDKWFIWFNHSDNLNLKDTKIKNIDLDKL